MIQLPGFCDCQCVVFPVCQRCCFFLCMYLYLSFSFRMVNYCIRNTYTQKKKSHRKNPWNGTENYGDRVQRHWRRKKTESFFFFVRYNRVCVFFSFFIRWTLYFFDDSLFRKWIDTDIWCVNSFWVVYILPLSKIYREKKQERRNKYSIAVLAFISFIIYGCCFCYFFFFLEIKQYHGFLYMWKTGEKIDSRMKEEIEKKNYTHTKALTKPNRFHIEEI